MQIEAIKVRRLYLEVAGQIEKLVSSGQIKPKQRLPSERDLAARFGVSRPTIREAMIALEISGLVEVRTGSGIYVLDKKETDSAILKDEGPGPFEILEARRILESETVALAAARITPEQLAELELALRDMEREDADGNVTEQADQRFHCIIAAASQNSALAAVTRWLWELRNCSEIGMLFHRRIREDGVMPSLEEHRRIFNALKNRDPMTAKNAMMEHISRAIETDMKLLENTLSDARSCPAD